MTDERWARSQVAFADAAGWFCETVRSVRDEWDELGLGVWSVRDLVGHTSRALLTVESYLGKEEGAVEVTSAVDYFSLILTPVGDPLAVADRGRQAGVALGSDPVESVCTIATRVVGTIGAAAADELAATPAGRMYLRDYLPTRTFELTVHTGDLVSALGRNEEPPETAGIESLTLLGELAVRGGHAAELLAAATGRRGLASSFTLL